MSKLKIKKKRERERDRMGKNGESMERERDGVNEAAVLTNGEFLYSNDGSDARMTIQPSALMGGQIQRSGIISRSEINNEHDHVAPPPPPPAEPSPNPSAEGWWKKLEWNKMMEWVKYPNKSSEDDRDLLMVVATMISTMTFQAVANPPGGVWQENNTNTSILLKDGSNHTVCSEENLCVAGTAVLGHVFPTEFLRFIKFNTISFLASLSVILLLVGGCPRHNRICMWLLTMAMCVTLTFMALTYLQVLLLVVVPFGDLYKSSDKIYKICFELWIGLLVMVSVIITIRFLIWVVKKSRPAYSGLQKIISNRSFCRNV